MNDEVQHKHDSIRDTLRCCGARELMRALGWDGPNTPIPADAWATWGWLRAGPNAEVVAHTPGFRAVWVSGDVRRDLCVAIHRHAPLETVLWLFESSGEVTLAIVVEAEERPKVRTLTIDLGEPDAMGLARLELLRRSALAQPDERDAAQALSRHVAEVFDHETVTRAFFDGLRTSLRRLAEKLQNGPTADAARWEVSLVVLLRLLFLYFLQREGLLNGDRRYVARHVRSTTGVFERVLRPLFFGVLNTPVGERDGIAAQLGRVPFLNGGLFEPIETERAYLNISWPDEVIRDVVDGVFERFHFTAVEPSGRDEAAVVDPEMLGKVFEGLMMTESRKGSGSFYTPRDVVRAMVDDAIDAHLADRADEGIGEDAALRSLTILDPAVGSGAFLLEALSSLRERCERSTGRPADYATMRRLVHRHLFGVDRNRAAVRLCELRIWLAMLAALRRTEGVVEPLPNLGHRIAPGDSLLDGIDVAERRGAKLHPAHLVDLLQLEVHHARLQEEYLGAHGAEKRALSGRLESAETRIQTSLVDAQIALIDARIAPLRAAVTTPNLLGDTGGTTEQRSELAAMSAARTTLCNQREAIVSGRGAALGFAYESRFGAPARDGFDIIVTNPPWVRAQRLERPRRQILAHRYQTARSELWPGAGELGIRAPYGAQPDLAALFVERSLQLLRPGGRLAALIPAKLLRGLHGTAMRRLLAEHCLESIQDLSDASQQLFDATTYPAIIQVRKNRPARERVDVRVVRGDDEFRFPQPVQSIAHRGINGAPWSLLPPRIRALIERVQCNCPALGELPTLDMRRGIFTGANDVFLRPAGGFVQELGVDAAPYVRPVVTGSSLGEGATREILWCYRNGVPLTHLPASVKAYFDRHRPRLDHRSDVNPRLPAWQLFRVPPPTQRFRVAWRDLSELLEPHPLPPTSVALNTVYFATLATVEEAGGFCAWMAHPLVQTVAHTIAERARGGWRRHFAWVVRSLPIPALVATQGFAAFSNTGFGLSDLDRQCLRQWVGAEKGARRVA